MYSAVKTYLTEKLKDILPGFAAHSKMLPPGRSLNIQPEALSQVRLSSVLVLLFEDSGKLYTCLTRRPSTMKHHPGQVSFPGGKVEKDDLSAESTALREANEEVGIIPENIEILGKLSDLYVEVSRFSIQPYVAWTNQKPIFEVNYSEVEALLLFPISEFVLDEMILETEIETVTGTLNVKYYPYNGEFIWGATAMILSELIEILKKHFIRP